MSGSSKVKVYTPWVHQSSPTGVVHHHWSLWDWSSWDLQEEGAPVHA